LEQLPNVTDLKHQNTPVEVILYSPIYKSSLREPRGSVRV